MKYSLGIDLGTTGVKALLVGTDGIIKSIGYAKYPLYTPQPQHAEQDPQEWWQGMCSAIMQALASSQINPKDILGVGFSGQMHGTVLLDKDGKVLCPAIIHCDQRAYREKQEILDKAGIDKLGSYVQNQVHSGFQATSLLWVRNNRPDIYDKIHTVHGSSICSNIFCDLVSKLLESKLCFRVAIICSLIKVTGIRRNA